MILQTPLFRYSGIMVPEQTGLLTAAFITVLEDLNHCHSASSEPSPLPPITNRTSSYPSINPVALPYPVNNLSSRHLLVLAEFPAED